MPLEKVPTGIEGFDELCEGGLIRGRSYTVEGAAGAGKSIFALQYLYNGATLYDEPGILVATEEIPGHIRENASTFGWDLRELENTGKLAILDASSPKIDILSMEKAVQTRALDVGDLLDSIIALQGKIKATRAVIDSTTGFGYAFESIARFRTQLHRIVTNLNMLGLTTLMTVEVKRSDPYSKEFGIESFVAQGVISIHYKRQESIRLRGLEVQKIRGTEHSHKVHPFDITSKGIVIHPKEELYGEF